MKKEYLVKEDGVRLDKYISQIDNEISRMMIQKLIENNKVYVNNKIEKASYKVKINDKIEMEIEEPKETKARKITIKRNI